MSATLRYNPKHTALEVTAGGLTWTEEIDSTPDSIMLHHSGGCYVVVPDGADLEGLDNNSVYRLVKETTVVKPEGEITDDDGTVLGQMTALPPPLEEIAQASLKRFEEFIGPVMLPTAKMMGYMEAFEAEIRRVIVEARSR